MLDYAVHTLAHVVLVSPILRYQALLCELPLCLEYAHSRERGVARPHKHPSSSRGMVEQSPELGQVAQQAHAEQTGGWQRVSFLQMG